MDGSHVTAVVTGTLPASRGSVRLASGDLSAVLLIDPNYYATEADRYVMRAGLRKVTYRSRAKHYRGTGTRESVCVAAGQIKRH